MFEDIDDVIYGDEVFVIAGVEQEHLQENGKNQWDNFIRDFAFSCQEVSPIQHDIIKADDSASERQNEILFAKVPEAVLEKSPILLLDSEFNWVINNTDVMSVLYPIELDLSLDNILAEMRFLVQGKFKDSDKSELGEMIQSKLLANNLSVFSFTGDQFVRYFAGYHQGINWFFDRGKDSFFEFKGIAFLLVKSGIYHLLMNICPEVMDFGDFYKYLLANISSVIELLHYNNVYIKDVELRNAIVLRENEFFFMKQDGISCKDQKCFEFDLDYQEIYDSDLILAQVADPVQASLSRTVLKYLCSVMQSFDVDKFAGTQLSCLSKLNKDKLFTQNYFVALKADGIRYIFLIYQGVGYFVNRRMKLFKLRLNLNGMTNLVIDGELLCGKEEETNYFVVFDTMFVGSRRVIDQNLKFRLNSCRPNLFELNKQLLSLPVSLSLIVQDYAPLDHIELVIKQRDKSVFQDDGLIFVPSDVSYCKGYSTLVMKLKDPINSTLDFKVLKYCDNPYIIELVTMQGNKFVHHDFSTLQEMIGKEGIIVECYWDPNYNMVVPSQDFLATKKMIDRVGAWRWKRDRGDKEKPNAHWVADDLCLLLKNSLSEQELVEFIECHRILDCKSRNYPIPGNGRGIGRVGRGRRYCNNG